MTHRRHVIRKTQPVPYRRIDDQLWPLAVAMVVLGGFLVGSVLAFLRLDDARWYANAWTWLIAIPLLIAASLAVLAWTGNRMLRRTMQLSIVLGVIIHIAMFLAAIETDVFQRIWVEVLAATDRPAQKRPVKVPDFMSWRQTPERRMHQDLNAPVEVRVPDPAVATERQERRPTVDTPPRPQPAPQADDVPLPSVVNRPEPNQAQPRQRDEMSKLSRREAAARQRPNQLAELPSVVPRPERREESPRPEDVGLRPQQLTDKQQRHAEHPPLEVPEIAPKTQVSRRQQPAEPTAEAPAAATVARRDQRQAVTPSTAADAAKTPDVARTDQPAAPQPQMAAAAVPRQQTRAPTTREQVESPQREVTAETARTRRDIEQPSPQRDTLAHTPRSVPNRQPRVTTRPDVTAVVDQVPDATATRADQPAAEAATTDRLERRPSQQMASVARAAQTVDTPAPSPAEDTRHVPRRSPAVASPQVDAVGAALPGKRPVESRALGSLSERVSPVASAPGATEPSRTLTGPAASANTQVAKQAAGNAPGGTARSSAETVGAVTVDQTPIPNSRATTASGAPSLAASSDSNSRPRRAVQSATAAVSPLAAETPTHGAADSAGAETAAAPAAMALSKGEIGSAGRGSGRNLGQAEPAAASPAAVASGSARRAQATQDLPPGPALEPHDAAIVRRGPAGSTRPSAVLQATLADDPALAAGARQTADLQASTSAALTQAASNAERGGITAAKGDLEVDTGPTTLVTEAGAGRGAGGGQPELSFGTRRDALPRAQPGQSPVPSLLADSVGATTAAPPAEGGGQPSAAAVDVDGNSLANARSGPEPAEFGGPRAVGGGSLDAPTLSPTHSSRRAHGMLDELAQQDARSSVTRALPKAAHDRQLPGDIGAADLVAGNAAEHSDDELPSSTVAASDTTVSVPQRMLRSGGGQPGDQPAPPVGEGSGVTGASAALAGRAEAVEAAPGLPAVGGGTGSPPRAGQGPEVVAATAAETVELAGNPASAGSATAPGDELQAPATTELARGAKAAPINQPVAGGGEISTLGAGVDMAPAVGSSRREGAPLADDGPLARDDANRGGPGKRSSRVQPSDEGVTVDLADLVSPSDVMPGKGSDVALAVGDPLSGPASRYAGQALPADIDAPVGVGGLGSSPTVEVGLPTRHAAEASADLQLDAPRFNRNRLGGQPSLDSSAAMPTESFQRRIQRVQGTGDAPQGPGPQTEDAIELGLVFLSKAQLPDGRWSLDRFAKVDGLPQMSSDSAATGLALLAFQGAGYNHMDFRYAQTVRAGIGFLLKNQQPDGSLFVPMDEESNRVVQFYSHSIAALALCEAYGMTQDPMLRDPAQRAIDYIVETQNTQRGGWRYTVNVSSDTSVTGWMMMALKSGELANLKVPKTTYQLIDGWLDKAQASPTEPHLYCYNPYAPDSTEQRAGRSPTPTMTSVGLLMRLYLGWRRNNPAMARGAVYLAKRPPAIGTKSDPQRDTYYWYYGTQVMFHMGGQYWRDWNQALHPLLVDTQIREGELAGSWDPRRPVPDRWAAHAGRLYVTTLNLLSLEVTYRHLPLYEDTAK